MVSKHRGARRSAAKEAEWRRVIKEWRESGETLPDFAAERGLSRWTVRWWCTELKKRDAERSRAGKSAEGAPGAALDAGGRLVPVRVIDGRMARENRQARPRRASGHGSKPASDWGWARRPEGDGVIEIVPFGEVRIRVPPGFDPRTLGEILRVLERPC
jgi:hypothetical protein